MLPGKVELALTAIVNFIKSGKKEAIFWYIM
jgi:hypothetical protein